MSQDRLITLRNPAALQQRELPLQLCDAYASVAVVLSLQAFVRALVHALGPDATVAKDARWPAQALANGLGASQRPVALAFTLDTVPEVPAVPAGNRCIDVEDRYAPAAVRAAPPGAGAAKVARRVVQVRVDADIGAPSVRRLVSVVEVDTESEP